MKVLSLFDGISCGMVALERAGIPVERKEFEMMIIAQLVLMIIAVLIGVYGMYLTCRDWKKEEEEQKFEEHVEDLMEMIKK